jgi:hypothetical protein
MEILYSTKIESGMIINESACIHFEEEERAWVKDGKG